MSLAGTPPSPPVAITVNGESISVAPGLTLDALVASLRSEPRGVAVAVDGEVVPRRAWGRRALGGGEQVEVLSIAQGG